MLFLYIDCNIVLCHRGSRQIHLYKVLKDVIDATFSPLICIIKPCPLPSTSFCLSFLADHHDIVTEKNLDAVLTHIYMLIAMQLCTQITAKGQSFTKLLALNATMFLEKKGKDVTFIIYERKDTACVGLCSE